jgi:hypothetical protein
VVLGSSSVFEFVTIQADRGGVCKVFVVYKILSSLWGCVDAQGYAPTPCCSEEELDLSTKGKFDVIVSPTISSSEQAADSGEDFAAIGVGSLWFSAVSWDVDMMSLVIGHIHPLCR